MKTTTNTESTRTNFTRRLLGRSLTKANLTNSFLSPRAPIYCAALFAFALIFAGSAQAKGRIAQAGNRSVRPQQQSAKDSQLNKKQQADSSPNDGRLGLPAAGPAVFPTANSRPLVSGSNGPDSIEAMNNYAVTRQTGIAYSSIVGTGTSVTGWRNTFSTDDNMSTAQPIGFTFIYNGAAVTQFLVSTNGFITFNTSTTATGAGTGATAYSFTNAQFSASTATTAQALAPFYDDQQTAANLGTLADLNASIKYQTTGAVGSRVLTVEWINFQDFATSSTASLNYQVKLYEADGHIEFVYGTMTPGAATWSYTLGINALTVSASPTAAELLTQQTANTATFSNTPSNALATIPATNTQITLTPPATTPAAATNLTFPSIGSSYVTLNWIDNAANEINYNVLISTDGGVTYQTFGAVLAPNTTSATIFGLSASTTYFFRVIATTEGIASAPLDGSVTTAAPVSGTKTLGPGGDYTSFTLAISDVNAGVGAGGVTFNVTAGATFTETPPCVTYQASAAAPVIFQKSGAGANPIIAVPGSASTQDSGICILGGRNITFDGIDVTPSAGNALVEYGALVFNSSATTGGAQNNTIKNSKITLNRTNTGSIGINQTFSVAATAAGGTNLGNKYYNITVENASRGILLNGTSTTVLDTANEIGVFGGGSTTIGSATVNDIGGGTAATYGIQAASQSGLKIFNTEVRNVGVTSGSVTVDGIFLSGFVGSNDVYNNKIHDLRNSSTSATTGITGIRATHNTTGTNVVRIYNNFIYNILSGYTGAASTTRQIKGILTGSAGGTTQEYDIDFNSVRIDGSGSPNISSTCFEIASTSGPVHKIRDNIFANVTGAQVTAKHYDWVSTSATSIGNTGSVSDRNDLYIANTTNGFVGLGNATDRTTLANWQTQAAGVDANSISVDPQFISATDLHVAVASPVVDAGSYFSGAITWANQDIDGQNRVGNPDIGADEPSGTTPLANDIAATAILVPAPGSSVTTGTTATPQATFTNVGTGTQTGVQVQFAITGPGGYSYSNTQTIATIVQNQTVTVTFATTPSFAAAGTYTATAATITPDQNASNDSVSGMFTAEAPLSGSYTVGAGGNYPTLTQAVSKLNSLGVTGATTLTLTDATYPSETFPITINVVPGASATNTVTIKPGVGVSPTITGSAAALCVINLNGADFVTIDGSNTVGGTTRDLSLVSGNASASAVVCVTSLGTGAGATFNTVKNTNLVGGVDPTTSTTDTFGIFSGGSGTPSTTLDGLDNDNNTFDNNAITKLRYGIYVRGAVANTNDGNTISGNTIGSTAFNTSRISKGGIVVQNQNTINITRNEVRFVGILAADTAGGTDRVGIGAGDFNWTPSTTVITNASVTRNSVHDIVEEKTFSSVGIILAPSGVTTTNNLVANNMIYNVRADGTSGDQGVGLGIGAGGDGDKVVFNSISMTGDIDPGTSTTASVSEAGVRISSAGSTNLTFKNNAIFVDQTSNTAALKHYAFVKPSATYSFGTGGSDNNDYFVNGSNTQMVLFGNGTSVPYTDVTTLAAFKAETPAHDQFSKANDPLFVSGTNLHLQPSSTLLGMGASIAGVTTDFDGDTRQSPPDIGADEIIAYTVTYDGNTNTGGTPPVDPSMYVPGATVTVLAPGSLSKTGYTFANWNTAANGSGTSYNPGATFAMPAGNVTLFAQWTINTYAVTYDSNGGTGTQVDPNSPYNHGSMVTVLGTGSIARTGYTFAHWNTAANDSGTSYNPGDMFTITSTTTLYAQWTINQYTLSYDGNGSTGGTVPAPQTADYNTSVTVAGAGSLVRTGYTFNGWNTLANGTGTAYAAGSNYTIPASNSTLYAQWTINQYTLSYDGNGSTGGTVPAPQTADYNTSVTVAGGGSLVRTGYTFNGWNTLANGTGTAYAAGSSYTIPASDSTLFAQWTVNTHTVMYDANGGTGSQVDPNSPYADGSTVTVLGTGTITRSGYVFAHWNTAANGSGISYNPSDTFVITNDVVLYAQWLSSNANLSSLTLSDGTLNPAFDPNVTSYTSSVPNSTNSMTVTPTSQDAASSIQVRVNGGSYSTVPSGMASGPLALNVGSNTVDVLVTAQDEMGINRANRARHPNAVLTNKTYTITVTRAASANADLSNLTLSAGTLTPPFASGTTSYTATVPNSTSSMTVTPTASDAGATIEVRVNGGSYTVVPSGNPSPSLALNVGDNPIDVRVTAADTTTIKIYTVTVHRSGPVTTNGGSGLAPDYASLAAAITALNGATMTSPVIITLNGNETAPAGGYAITQSGGTSTNTIVIQGNVSTITANAGLTVGALNDAIFKLIGANWVTIQNFTMQENPANTVTAAATNNMTEWGVALLHASVTQGSQNNTIQNNTISLNRTYSNSFGVYANNRHSATNVTTVEDVTNNTTGPQSGNKVYANAISNVNMGIAFLGSATAANMDVGTDIGGASAATGNMLTNWGGAAAATAFVSNATTSYCVFANHEVGVNLSYNTATSAAVNFNGTFLGFYVEYGTTAPTGAFTNNVTNNTVTMTNSFASATATQMHIIRHSSAAGANGSATANISNNHVANCAITGAGANALTLFGVLNTAGFGTVNMDSNTVDGTTSTATTGGIVGVTSQGAVVTAVNMTNNHCGTAAANFITFSAATSGAVNAVTTSTAAATSAVAITGNDVRGIVFNVVSTSAPLLINNSAVSLSQNISNNTFTNLNLNTTGGVTFMGDNVSLAATGSKTINGNSIVTGFNKGGAGGTVTFYTSSSFSVNGSTNVETNNNFSNVTVTGATTIGGWSNLEGNTATDSPAKTFTGNTFSNITGGTSAITVATQSFGGATTNASNNTISNVTGQGAITGLSFGSTNNGVTATANSITGLSSTGVGGTVTGIANTSSGANGALISQNTINTLSSTGASSSVFGISVSGGTTANVRQNTINTLSGSGGTSPLVRGISVSGGTTVNVFRNKIYDLSESGAISTTAGAVNGILLSGGTTVSAFNNLIGDLRAPAANLSDAIRGIAVTSATATTSYNVSYNSVYLNASSSGTNFSTSGVFHTASATPTTATLTLRNNVIVNTSTFNGTGTTVAYRRSGTALNNYGSGSNNNDFYAGTPGAGNLIFNDTVNSDQTIQAYKARVTTRDSASFTENPTFLSTSGANANFLHINSGTPSHLESGAANVAGITDDYDSDIRQGNPGYSGSGTAPDVGADEFGGTALAFNANLSNLTLSSGTLTPAFDPNTTSYTATVSNATTSITETPTAQDPTSTIQVRVNGGSYVPVASGSPSGPLALNVGANTVDTLVTAQDGTTTKTYTVTVTRAASSNADLSNLTLSDGTLTPAFTSGNTSYTASVPNSTSSMTVTPTASDPATATIQVRVNGGSYSTVASGSPSGPLALNVGSNTIDVLVTAQDSSTKTYTVTVTRAATIQFSINDVTQAETNSGQTAFTFTVTKTGSGAATVDFQTQDGTATEANNDYLGVSGTLSFASGDTSLPITVMVNGDTTPEPDETFTLHLMNPGGGSTITDADGLATITNDDGPPLIVYVDDDWSAVPAGQDPDGIGPATSMGFDAFATISGGVAGVANPGTVIVRPGNYTDNVSTTKTLSMRGAQFGVDARGRVVGAPNPAVESVWSPTTAGTGTLIFNANTTATVVDGFAFTGGTSLGVIQTQSGTDFSNFQVSNNYFSGYSQSAVFLNRGGSDITIDKNVMDGSSISGSGQAIFGNGPQNFNGLWITNNNVVNNTGRYGFFVDGNHNMGESATRASKIDGNLFNNNLQGLNLGSRSMGTLGAPVLGAYAGYITNNTFSNHAANGIQAGIQHVLVQGNTFSNNATDGLALTSFGNTGADRGAQNSDIKSNYFTTSGRAGLFFSGTQGAGLIETNKANFNRFVGNAVAIQYGSTVAAGNNGTINVENNWFGCNYGPGAGGTGCSGTTNGTLVFAGNTGVLDSSPWIVLGVSASPNPIAPGGNSTVTADMTHNSDNAVPSGTMFVPNEPVAFSATEGTIAPPSGTITNGQAMSTFTSTSNNDGTASAVVDGQTVTTTIDVTSPTFTINDVTQAETDSGQTMFTFTVTKTGSTPFTSTIDYQTMDGSATDADNDYEPTTGTLTFGPSDTTMPVTVLVNGDTKYEGNETFTVELSNQTVAGESVNGAVVDSGTGTITNDDPQPSFSINDVTMAEGNGGTTMFTFTVTKTGATGLPASVNFMTMDGSATVGDNDYQMNSGVLTFGPTDTMMNVTVLVNGDTTVEPNETFTVELSGATNAVILDGSGLGTITNDDVPPPNVVYVDDDWASVPCGQDPDGGGPATSMCFDAFSTIQGGINGVANPGTVIVYAGNYLENPNVNKALNITGPNAGIPGSGVRAAEAFVRTVGNQNAVFSVSSNNVTINGFSLDGDDPGVTGVTLGSGDDSNTSYGVRPSGNNHIVVRDNIIKRVAIGFRGDGASQNNLITENWFDSVGFFDFGYAVSLRTNYYADVTSNKMTRVWTGVHTNNFSTAGGPATWLISSNEIHSYAAGILYWLQFNSATSATINANTITAEGAAVANNFGMLFVSTQNTVSPVVTNNTISGTDYGVGLTNTSTSNVITFDSSNSINATSIAGVYLTDNLTFNPVGTTDLTTNAYIGAANNIAVNINGMAITAADGAGVRVENSRTSAADVSSTMMVNGSTITGPAVITPQGPTSIGVDVIGKFATANVSKSLITRFDVATVLDGVNAPTEPVTLTITNSTLSGNTGAAGALSATGNAGGNAKVTITNSTLTDNAENQFAIYLEDASLTVGNSIFNAGSGGTNIQAVASSTVTSLGYNLSSDPFGGFLNSTGDQVNTDPMLGPLKNNGGPTLTHAPLENSPAIDQGKDIGPFAPGHTATGQDQRGAARPVNDPDIANAVGGDGSDIGAVELAVGVHPSSAASRKTHGAAGDFDVSLPLTGPVGIECRTGGGSGNYQMIVLFETPVTFSNAAVTSGTGMVSSTSIMSVTTIEGGSGTQVTINLTGVTDVQTLTVGIFDVDDGMHMGDVGIQMHVMIGDVTGNGAVNASDVSSAKAKIGQPVNGTTFRADVTVNGDINASDVALIKSKFP